MPQITIDLDEELDKKVRQHMVDCDLTSKEKSVLDIIKKFRKKS